MKVLILFLISVLLNQPDPVKIYEWRGHERTGIYEDKDLLRSWPDGGPRELWWIDNVGNGYGSPVFTEDRFYITGESDSICYLYCFSLEGEKQWQASLEQEWVKSSPGSRSSPTVAGDLIYAGTGNGNLFCLDRKSGKILWSKRLKEDFQGVLPLHGHSESPLVSGNKVFWTPGGKKHNVVAIDRFTGKLIWTNKGFGESSGYNHPKLIKHGQSEIMVTFSSYHLMGFDTKTGELLWWHEQDNYPIEKRAPGYGDTHANTVLYENGCLWYAEGDGNGGVKLEISPDGKTIKEVWRNGNFDSYMGGIIKLGNYIYGCGTKTPHLKVINATTGEITDSLRIGSGAVISADNMIYYYTQKGEMMLFGSNNGRIEKVSSFKISRGSREHFSHPVINKGILYQRHGNVLIAYDLRK